MHDHRKYAEAAEDGGKKPPVLDAAP